MAGRKTSKRNVLELCLKHAPPPCRRGKPWFETLSKDCREFLIEAKRLISTGEVVIGGAGLLRVMKDEFPNDALKSKHTSKRLNEWIKQ